MGFLHNCTTINLAGFFLFLILIDIICTVSLPSNSWHLVRLGLIDPPKSRIIFQLFSFFHHLLHLSLFRFNELFDGTNILWRSCCLPCSHQGSSMCHYFLDHLVLGELFVVFWHSQRMIFISINVNLNSIPCVIYVIWGVDRVVLSTYFVFVFLWNIVLFIFANFDNDDCQGRWRNHANDDHNDSSGIPFLWINLLNYDLWLTRFLNVYILSVVAILLILIGLFSLDSISLLLLPQLFSLFSFLFIFFLLGLFSSLFFLLLFLGLLLRSFSVGDLLFFLLFFSFCCVCLLLSHFLGPQLC